MGSKEEKIRQDYKSQERLVGGNIVLRPADAGGKRRSRMRIIADILGQAQRPAKKTHIMNKCHLSFKQLKHYLNLLKQRGLIQSKTDTGAIMYQTTNNGNEFLRRYSSIARLLRIPTLKHS
jgi:predicted transcriptional regulator